MSRVCLIELMGGAEDGRIFEVPEETINARYIILPRVHVQPVNLHEDFVNFARVKWEWDGTLSARSGAYRFREVPL